MLVAVEKISTAIEDEKLKNSIAAPSSPLPKVKSFHSQTVSATFGQVVLKDHASFTQVINAQQRVVDPLIRVNLPPILDLFTGRVELLKRLESACEFKSYNPLEPRRWLHIHGLAGLGKSETAIAFANQQLDKVSLVWHISCENDLIYDEGYRSLARSLKIPSDKDNTEQVVRKVHLYLENWQEEKPWILILDNAEKPLPIPARGGVVITTSQSEKLGSENPIIFAIEPFDLLETEQFLLKCGLQPSQIDQIESLHRELEGWPLLLSQVPSYLLGKNAKISDYLAQLRSMDPIFAKDEFAKYPRSLGQAFEITLETIEQAYPESDRLLYTCTYLNPDLIDEELFKSWYEDTQLSWSKKAINPLKNCGILRKADQRNTFRLHKLWQKYLQKHLAGQGQASIQFAIGVNLVLKLFERFDHRKRSTWELGKLGAHHVRDLLSYDMWNGIDKKKQYELLSSTGIWLLSCQSSLVEAEHYFHAALKVCDSELEQATCYNFLGNCCFSQWKAEEALKYHQLALKLRKRNLVENHPEIGRSQHNVGFSYYLQDNLDEALKYFEKAIQIMRANSSENNSDLGWVLHKLGFCYEKQGEYQKALNFHQQALDILMNPSVSLVENHPDVAQSLEHVAYSHSLLGNYDASLEAYQKAYEIRKKYLDQNHPDIGWSLHNRGLCYYLQGKYKEAFEDSQQSIKIMKLNSREDHYSMGWFLHLSGFCYEIQGKYQEALQSHLKAFEILKSKLGETHSKLAISLNNLGTCLFEQGKFDEALNYHQQAQKILEFKKDHHNLASSLNGIANCYYSQGFFGTALMQYSAAMSVRKKALGEKHPDVAESLCGAANCLTGLGKCDEALKMHTQALEIRQNSLGNHHPDVAKSLTGIADVYYARGQFKEALKQYTNALQIREPVLGKEHLVIAKNLEKIKICNNHLARPSDS